MSAKIIYTLTDEAPALATYSLLPIVQAFTGSAGCRSKPATSRWPVASWRTFRTHLTPAQRQSDDLAELGELAKTPDANIIKLPNISASVPQLQAAIKELQSQGYEVPDYPEGPTNDAEKQVRKRYAKVLGSAVNPVLREGNSDRRVAKAVKQYAKKHPHSMGEWSADSKTHVAHMTDGDFYGNEQSAVIAKAGTLRIEFTGAAGKVSGAQGWRARCKDGELIGTTFMQRRGLRDFYAQRDRGAKAEGLLLSLHLKATMMKVSDPIMFGHAVSVYYQDVFEKHGALSGSSASTRTTASAPCSPRSSRCRCRSAPRSRPTSPPSTPRAAAGDGRLRQGHHQPARAERRDHRCLDAGRDPHLGPDVGPGRQAARHDGDDPGSLLRRRLPGGHRRLPQARRLRRADHGQRQQRRPDGAGGRGIRLARQDLRDRRSGIVRVVDADGKVADRAPGRQGRHLAHVPDQGRRHPRLGEARRESRARHRPAGHLLARRASAPTTAT